MLQMLLASAAGRMLHVLLASTASENAACPFCTYMRCGMCAVYGHTHCGIVLRTDTCTVALCYVPTHALWHCAEYYAVHSCSEAKMLRRIHTPARGVALQMDCCEPSNFCLTIRGFHLIQLILFGLFGCIFIPWFSCLVLGLSAAADAAIGDSEAEVGHQA